MEDYKPHVRYLANIRENLSNRLKRISEQKHKHMKTGITAVEVTAGSFLAGVVSGRTEQKGGAHILGVPVSLAAGGVLIAAGVFEALGKHSDHLTNVGTGALAEYAANMGFGVGQKWHNTGHLFGKSDPTAALPPGATTSSGDLSPNQMADIVRQVRGG